MLCAAVCFVKWCRPLLVEGEHCVRRIPELLLEDGVQKPLIVTDPGISALGLTEELLETLDRTALLDPRLTAGLPAGITAATGMDALIHAVEVYIGRSNTGADGKQTGLCWRRNSTIFSLRAVPP